MRRRALAGIVAALVIALSAAAARAQDTAAPLFNAADLQFLQHMIVHHEQALTMCAWVPQRTERGEFARFARYVDRAQAAEIQMMQALLDIAAERRLEIPAQHLHGDPPMPGMLSMAEMEAIEAARGAEFDRLWLEGMIVHHEGAVAMAHAQQEQQLTSGRRPYGLDVLIEDILVEQRAEISKMRAWLADWGLASAP